MILNHQTFYRKYGVRMLSQVLHPLATDLKFLELPLESIYHFVRFDGTESGPPSDDYLFRNIKKPILVKHFTELKIDLGSPRKLAINLPEAMRDYHAQHRRMRMLRNNDTADRDKNALVVYNYSLLGKSYRYVHSFFTEYHKWYNIFATTIQAIAETTEISERHHFLMVAAPKLIPSITQLENAEEEVTQESLKYLRDKDAYVLLELWKWLGEKRDKSLFSRIPENKIHLIDLVFQENGKWMLVNLGTLNSFRLPKDPEKETAVLRDRQRISPAQMQKRLLRMFMSVMELRTLTANLSTVEEDSTEGDDIDLPNPPELDDAELENPDFEEDTAGVPKSEPDQIVEDDSLPETPPEPINVVGEYDDNATDEELAAQLQAEDALLDEQLSQLNEIAQKKEEELGAQEATLHEVIFEDKGATLEEGVMNVCDRLADEGLLSAGEYKRFSKLANAYKTMQGPDGRTPLGEFIQIKPEELAITESSSVPDSKTVLDKTMLKSSLLSFDDRYIADVMLKDTAAMILNVQNAGVAVSGYRVDEHTDILGGYQMHTLKLTPVIGAPSTIRFKLPVVERDGTFTSNGVKYRLRKQRGDLPIRKINPTRVALTSYYGKVFVSRSIKKADDYGYWLQCKFTEKILDKSNSDITEVALSNVFDNALDAPRTYGAFSQFVKSFKCKGFTFVFDKKEQQTLFPEKEVARYEKSGSVVIARNNGGQYLLLDKNNTLYIAQDKTLTPYGDVETFIGLQVSGAPVEFASLAVYGKTIPIGVILGMTMGIDKLLRLLKVQPRRVPTGSRLNMALEEYAITFSDESLIFSKDDRFASMVLAGFNDYAKALKLFSVHSFNKRGVYVNLLESNGLGVRYVREIELMYAMFIDPITRDLLIEMKEPLTFQGLLLRSCELLLNDQHPHELDPAYMRIKGYERMAGAVYTELVQSLRAHNGRLGKSNVPVEMNPYAVWKRVSEDSAKSQVNEINPIEALKQTEAVTFAGSGGRSKQSMTKHTREYHPNDMGTISESTVDSSDVAINIFTSADPQFTSLRGMSKRYKLGETGATALLSTSALISPASDTDDQIAVLLISNH